MIRRKTFFNIWTFWLNAIFLKKTKLDYLNQWYNISKPWRRKIQNNPTQRKNYRINVKFAFLKQKPAEVFIYKYSSYRSSKTGESRDSVNSKEKYIIIIMIIMSCYLHRFSLTLSRHSSLSSHCSRQVFHATSSIGGELL